MKKSIFTSILVALIAIWNMAGAQTRQEEYLGLPGDNLNLYAVMKLFQESETLEGFERSLNDEKTGINNLDLNGDNLVDYITVSDYLDGNVHNIVLRVALGPEDNQDVAVFTVERFQNGSVQIQLIGDEALYGKNYMVEPRFNDQYGETPNPGYTGNSVNGQRVAVVTNNYYEVAAWPLVRFIFYPDYIAWHSPWYWGCHFSWWNPWNTWSWHYYYGYHYNWYPQYYAHFQMGHHYRYARYNDYYYHGIRNYSSHVSERIRHGGYRSSYSHPEQRLAGEARYSRVQSERNSRLRENSSTVNRERTNDSQSRNRQNISGTRFNSGNKSNTSLDSRTSRSTSPSVRSSRETIGTSSSVSRQRNINTTPDRNNTIARKSASLPTVNRGSGYSADSRRITSDRSSSTVREPNTSRSSYNSGNTTSRSSAPSTSLKSASRSSQGHVASSSARSSSGSSAGFSSRSSGGQNRSSVSSRSSGGQSRSSSNSGGRSGGSSGTGGGSSRSSRR
jgi:hypothetical protein